MSTINDGGQAFPCYQPEGRMMQDGAPEHSAMMVPGMSLRDYFAAKALQGIEASQGKLGCFVTEPEKIAARAYELADAMLREREGAV